MDKVQKLAESKTNVVFVFGYTGTGKTTFLLVLYKYLWEKYKFEFNTKSNREGINYLNNLLEDFDNTILPSSTSRDVIEEVDWKITLNDGTKIIFTFIDMSGEDLSDIKTFDLNKEIAAYLNNKELSLTLLCLVDYDKPARDDKYIHNLLIYIDQHLEFDLSRFGIIITKWDNNFDETTKKPIFAKAGDYLKSKKFQSDHWLRDKKIGDRKRGFEFSIGEIDKTNPTRLIKLDTSYCENIVNWLISSAKKTIKPSNNPNQDNNPASSDKTYQKILDITKNLLDLALKFFK